uniref:SH3 domain-containing protein n=1 Tax=Mesocestoides corti TaxID=53468 RepID=A0A5K3F1Z7_MESCO
MQPTDVDGDSVAGTNFWEPHEYSRTVKRLENANKLCSEFALMIQERSEIERAYASNLRKFAFRLDLFLRSGLEYGTCSNILSGLAKEAEDTAELHSNFATNLLNPVQSSIKNWQKENFHKSSMSSSLKEVKSLDSDFENAQKTWYKHYKQVNRCKKEYFHACKIVRSQQVQVQNAKNEPFGTPEQQALQAKELRKMEEKLRKATSEEEKTRRAYEEAVAALQDVTPRYIDDMTQVFNKAQAFEKERINFFKQQAMQMHDVLDVSAKPNLAQIFVDLKNTISKVDADADLKKWSVTHGVDTPINFPSFEEYSPELCALAGSKKKKSGLADGNIGVTLTGVKSITSPDHQPAGTPHPGSNESSPTRTAANNPSSINGIAATAAAPADVPPYPDLIDDGRPGVPIRALYDYTGVEADELSFNTGDLFEKLEDEDEQGWCKGRKDGRVGLYPANYVEVVR